MRVGVTVKRIAGPSGLTPHLSPRPHVALLARGPALRAASSPGQDAADAMGVVVVDHGSRRAESNGMLLEFVELYKTTTGTAVVEGAHMEIAEPTIEQAIGKCSEQGATSVVIAPYFLSRGRHIQEDIPRIVAEAQSKYPGVKCVIADPIGIDPLMVQLINQRVQSAVR